MVKRYIIKRNNITIAEVDNILDIYKAIGSSKQNYYQTLQYKIFDEQFKYNKDIYNVIDRLNVK